MYTLSNTYRFIQKHRKNAELDSHFHLKDNISKFMKDVRIELF